MTTGPEHIRDQIISGLSAHAELCQDVDCTWCDTAAEQADALLADLAPILDEVAVERARQYATYGPQPIPLGTGRPGAGVAAARARAECELVAARGELTLRHVLDEEYRELVAEADPARVREEAIQVAAVAIQIVQRCDQLLTGASDQP